jgi:hypothetical protein
MKKILMTLVFLFCCITIALAQSAQEGRNRRFSITLGNVQYAHHDEKLSTSEVVSKVISGVLTGQTSVQATKYEEDVKNAIIKGLSNAYRFHYYDGLSRIGT